MKQERKIYDPAFKTKAVQSGLQILLLLNV